MALFKVFRGQRNDLDNVAKVDGHAYFCTDDGSFWIDYLDGTEIKRKQVNESELMDCLSLSNPNLMKENSSISFFKDIKDSTQNYFRLDKDGIVLKKNDEAFGESNIAINMNYNNGQNPSISASSESGLAYISSSGWANFQSAGGQGMDLASYGIDLFDSDSNYVYIHSDYIGTDWGWFNFPKDEDDGFTFYSSISLKNPFDESSTYIGCIDNEGIAFESEDGAFYLSTDVGLDVANSDGSRRSTCQPGRMTTTKYANIETNFNLRDQTEICEDHICISHYDEEGIEQDYTNIDKNYITLYNSATDSLLEISTSGFENNSGRFSFDEDEGGGTLATREWVEGVIAGKVDYLGTVASIADLAAAINNATDPTPGDYCRASAEFTLFNSTEAIHIGDILIYKNDGVFGANVPAKENWDIIHTEDPGNYVDLTTEAQVISGYKQFDGGLSATLISCNNLSCGPLFNYYNNGGIISFENHISDNSQPPELYMQISDAAGINQYDVNKITRIVSSGAYTHYFPNESGTLATQEWVNQKSQENSLDLSIGAAAGSLQTYLVEDGTVKGSTAHGKYSIALNQDNNAYQRNSFAIGGGTQAGMTEEEFNEKYPSGVDEHGYNYSKANSYAFASGQQTKALGRGSAAFGGYLNKVEGDFSAIFGGGSNIIYAPYAAIIGGYDNIIETEGEQSTILGGNGNRISGPLASALGISNEITASNCHAIGANLKLLSSYGPNRIAVGRYNNDKSYAAFQVGIGTDDSNRKNAFEVYETGAVVAYEAPTTEYGVVRQVDLLNGSILNVTNGDGAYSLVFNNKWQNFVSGEYSGAGGKENSVLSNCSYAFGTGLTLFTEKGHNKFAVGKYNNQNSYAIFQVGNGTSDADRRNAFEVFENGKVQCGSNTTEEDGGYVLTTKYYVDARFNAALTRIAELEKQITEWLIVD